MLMELRVARAWQVPPTALQKWSHRDRAMATALLIHEADIGPCGYPHRTTTDPDLDGWFEVDPGAVCAVCAAFDRYRKDHADADSQEPGQLLTVKDLRHENHRDEEG